MLDIVQFRKLIIVPALSDLKMYSKQAEELLVFTCACESEGGTYIKQITGPALGIYQMEPATYHDIWDRYIVKQSGLLTLLSLKFTANRIAEVNRMTHDLRYATAIARLFYRMQKEPLPSHTDVNAIWAYYKKYWNTEAGKAQKDKSIAAYKKFAGKTIPQADNETLVIQAQ